MAHAEMDGVAVFGFISGFFTVVVLAYGRHLRTRLPVIAAGLACCTAYGFLAGAWPAGIVLMTVTVLEIGRWWHALVSAPADPPVKQQFICPPRVDRDSRIHRMFGRA